MFWAAVRPLLEEDAIALERLDSIRQRFAETMQQQLQTMWAAKLGLAEFNPQLFNQLIQLMSQSEVDYTIFFRELSNIPDDIVGLKKSFYVDISTPLDEEWKDWLIAWRKLVIRNDNQEEISMKMKRVNPKFTWREWLIVPAYEQAQQGDYSLIKELQEVLSHPYEEQSQAIEEKYYRLKPEVFFNAGGVSHYRCSS